MSLLQQVFVLFLNRDTRENLFLMDVLLKKLNTDLTASQKQHFSVFFLTKSTLWFVLETD